MASTATRKAATRNRVSKAATTTKTKGTTKATAKKAQPSKPEKVNVEIEARTIVPISFARGRFSKEGTLEAHEPAGNGGVRFEEVDDDGNQAESPVLRTAYVSQETDKQAGSPQEMTLLLVVA